ncbi:UNVERIFIED_CONTAM: hypothetical protein FKN15_039907 [Acipenser sinensis]
MAEDATKLRDWFLENAGLEAQSLPMVVRTLWMMDSERWEAYQREHTPNNLEEGVELVLSYLEATINGTAAQVAGPPAEEYLLSPSPPAEGECLLVLPPQPKREAQKDKEVKDREEECRLRARHPRRCNKPSPWCLLCDQDHLFTHCPFRSYGEQPERPQPKCCPHVHQQRMNACCPHPHQQKVNACWVPVHQQKVNACWVPVHQQKVNACWVPVHQQKVNACWVPVHQQKVNACWVPVHQQKVNACWVPVHQQKVNACWVPVHQQRMNACW